MIHRTQDDYYVESKRLRREVLLIAEQLKDQPLRFIITNEITMRVEITKTDLKTLVSKNVRDNKFNAIKNALAKDIPGYLAKAEYLGWRPVAEGKHIESAYFAYFSRELGCRTILCMRRIADGDIYKPYAIIDEHTFEMGEANCRNKKLRLNKSLADSNGALVLGGASYPILIGRLPIQTGLLPYIVFLRCKYTNYI